MRRLVLVLGLVIGLGFAAGWASATMAPPAQALYQSGAELRDGRLRARAALEHFISLGLAAPPAEVPSEPLPPDVALVLRRDLTAIERTSQGPVAWIVDLDQPSGRRALKRGDVYQGWSVAAVNEQRIELRRGQEVRYVNVLEAPQEVTP